MTRRDDGREGGRERRGWEMERGRMHEGSLLGFPAAFCYIANFGSTNIARG